MQIHELDNYSGNLDAGAFFAVDDGFDTGKVSADQINAAAMTQIGAVETSLNARIDNIIAGGDAPSAAEVTDARQGAAALGSRTYASLGAAIRGQATILSDDSYRTDDKSFGLIGRANKVVSGSWNKVTLISGLDLESGKNYLLRLYLDQPSEQSGYFQLENSSGTAIAVSDTLLNQSGATIIFKAGMDYSDAKISLRFSSGDHPAQAEIYSVYDGDLYRQMMNLGQIRLDNKYLRNGAILNQSNAYYVAGPVIRTKAKTIQVSTNRPNSANCIYMFSFRPASEEVWDTLYNGHGGTAIETQSNIYEIPDNNIGVQIAMAEYNTSTQTYSPLRITDFADYEIIVSDISARELENRIRFFDLSTVTISGSQMRNGSALNAGNLNAVAVPVIHTQAKAIKIITDRPNLVGYEYLYSYVTVTQNVDDVAGTGYYTGFCEDTSGEYTIADGGVGVQFGIFERNKTDGTFSPLRVGDFEGYKVYVYDISSEETEIPGVPGYYNDYIEARIGTIRDKDLTIGNSGESYIFITDPHEREIHYSPLIAKHIINKTSVDRLVYGGDYINQPTSKASAVSLLYDYVLNGRVIDEAVFMRGNHDTNPYGTGQLSESELYQILNSHIEKYVDTNKKYYFYSDNESQKIRTIFLDTGENGDIDEAQKTWLAGVVGELDSTWTIVVFSHMAIYCSGFDNRTPIDFYGVYNDAAPILRNAAADVACWICGHVHKDLEYLSEDFPVIAVTCDAYGVQATTQSTDNREAGTINEVSFNVFHIDTANKTVYMTRIGGGINNVRTSGDYSDNDKSWNYS